MAFAVWPIDSEIPNVCRNSTEKSGLLLGAEPAKSVVAAKRTTNSGQLPVGKIRGGHWQSSFIMSKPSNYVLGLDMGVASIGWAAVSKEEKFVDSGVRIFPAGVDKFGTGKDTHLNQERRKAREARRRHARKADRKKVICNALRELGWMPGNDEDLNSWNGMDVYELRARGLREELTL